MGIVNFAGGWVKTTSPYGDIQAWRAAQGVTSASDIDLNSSISSALSDAQVNLAQGAGDLAAQAAAKRLGITLASSSSSSVSTGQTAKATNPASSVTVKRVSSVVNSAFGNDYVAQNITGTLAGIDAITTGLSTISKIPTRALSSYGSNYAAQNITGYLANLDQINASSVAPIVNKTA